MLRATLHAYLTRRASELDQIPAARRELLERLGEFLRAERAAGRVPQLVFVCTHNSRRSHLGDLMAAAAGRFVGLPAATFSGGTEATAFHPHAVAAVRAAGFQVDAPEPAANPRYRVRLADGEPGVECFSKRFDAAPNPSRDFGAILVCTEADAACPNVPGAAFRLGLPYVDPKASDGSGAESRVYAERAAEIAREMLFAFRHAAAV